MLHEGHFNAEERAKFGRGQQVALRTVGKDAAVFHHDDAVDFGQDVCQMVGDHKYAHALPGHMPEGLAQLALGGEVEGVRRLVEQKHLRLVDKGPGDHDAPLLPGRHFTHQLRFEVGGLHEVEGLACSGAHFRRDVKVGPQGRRGEESGNHGIDAARDGRALAREFRGDDAEVGAQLRNIPALPAKEPELRCGRDDGVALAGDGADERGFAAAVGAEDGDVLAVGDAEGDSVQDDVVAAGDRDIVHRKEIGPIRTRGLIHQKIITERGQRTGRDDFSRSSR